MYTDYWVSAKITLDTHNNKTEVVNLYPLANSAEMAKDKLVSNINERYGKDYIKYIEILHASPIN